MNRPDLAAIRVRLDAAPMHPWRTSECGAIISPGETTSDAEYYGGAVVCESTRCIPGRNGHDFLVNAPVDVEALLSYVASIEALLLVAVLPARTGPIHEMTARVEAIRRWGLDGDAFLSGRYFMVGTLNETWFHMLGIGDSYEEAFESARRAGDGR